MENVGKIPRWVVEEDPLWEPDCNSGPDLLRWRRKGTNLFATCATSSVTCDVFNYATKLFSISNFRAVKDKNQDYLNMISRPSDPANMKRYLSSRYLNPYYDTANLLSRKITKLTDRPDVLDIT